MKQIILFTVFSVILSIAGLSQSTTLLPEAQEISVTFEQLQENPESKEQQKKYVDVFPDDVELFRKIYHPPTFDKLYSVSHFHIFKLAELSDSNPDEIGRKLVTLCVALQEWDSDAIGHVQFVTIGYANSHYDTFMEIVKGLNKQELDVLATFLADKENHSVYSDYADFLKKLQANREQTVSDVFMKAKEERISRKDHAF